MKNKSGRPLTGRSVQEILQDKRERAAKIAALSDNTQKDVKEGRTMTQAQQADIQKARALFEALEPAERAAVLQIMRDLKAQQDREAAQAAEAGRA